jgi:hypothetical protein
MNEGTLALVVVLLIMVLVFYYYFQFIDTAVNNTIYQNAESRSPYITNVNTDATIIVQDPYYDDYDYLDFPYWASNSSSSGWHWNTKHHHDHTYSKYRAGPRTRRDIKPSSNTPKKRLSNSPHKK